MESLLPMALTVQWRKDQVIFTLDVNDGQAHKSFLGSPRAPYLILDLDQSQKVHFGTLLTSGYKKGINSLLSLSLSLFLLCPFHLLSDWFSLSKLGKVSSMRKPEPEPGTGFS
jgi:hypothetical protein